MPEDKNSIINTEEETANPPKDLGLLQKNDVPVSRLRVLMSGIAQFYAENKYYVWAALVGLVILVTLAIFALKPSKTEPVPAKVELTIDAPEQAPSGGEQVYKFKITNKDSSTLTQIELELIYPDGVVYLDSTPKANSLSGTSFDVPDLSPGQNVAVLVKTKIQGKINDEKKIIAKLHYRYSNFNSEFISESSHTTRLIAADVALELSGPLTTNNAQVVTYTVKYKNNSDKDIENGRIEIKYPEHFQFADGSPQPNLGKNIWNVGTLSSQQEGEITFRGSFAGASAGRSEIFDIAFLVLDNSGKFFTQASTSFTTALETLPLFVTVEATSGAPNGIVKPGDSINYKVSYRNNASVPARGAIIVVNLESPAVSYSSIRAEGAQINNGTITWNASSDRNLEVINPNESGSFDFNLDVNNPPVRDTAKNIEVKTTVKIKSDEYETFLPGNELALKVSTLASVTASVEHTSGALPPKVGNSTTYTLTLALRNGTNDLKDGILTAFIPVASSGVDVSSVQPTKERTNVTFDASTGKITWKVGTLTAHTGTFSPLRKMSINVRITPSSGQAGKEVELLKSISYKTTDSFTSQNLTLTAESIGTGDLAGENNFNNGFVSP